ncbi:MAG: aminoglycoside phosphotransferase family protein [Candidatus Saccharimonadales bacterium]
MSAQPVYESPYIPDEQRRLIAAANAFSGCQPQSIEAITIGLVNQTYRVGTELGQMIIQRISPALHDCGTTNSVAIMEHMVAEGWEVPSQLRSPDGQHTLDDDQGHRWRAMSYVPSDPVPPMLGNAALTRAGRLLGGWHLSLAKSSYQPQPTIAHYRDTDHHAEHLGEVLAVLPSSVAYRLGRRALAAYDQLAAPAASLTQLIHGDPKLTNMLFRGGHPFTLIDYDTHMLGQTWMDLGDLARSVGCFDLANGDLPTINRLKTVIDGYRQATAPTADPQTFTAEALRATKHISLELTMRYLSDIVDHSYFKATDQPTLSRADYLLGRAHNQWRISELVSAKD